MAPAVVDALERLRAYLTDRADASCEPGDDRYRGNEESGLLADVAIIEKALKGPAAAEKEFDSMMHIRPDTPKNV